jgi:hypothetical protein
VIIPIHGGSPITDQATLHEYQVRGAHHESMAVLFGVLGIVACGLLWGLIALYHVNLAHKFGRPATAGAILGWVSVVLWVMIIGGAIVAPGFLVALGATAGAGR